MAGLNTSPDTPEECLWRVNERRGQVAHAHRRDADEPVLRVQKQRREVFPVRVPEVAPKETGHVMRPVHPGALVPLLLACRDRADPNQLHAENGQVLGDGRKAAFPYPIRGRLALPAAGVQAGSPRVIVFSALIEAASG